MIADCEPPDFQQQVTQLEKPRGIEALTHYHERDNECGSHAYFVTRARVRSVCPERPRRADDRGTTSRECRGSNFGDVI